MNGWNVPDLNVATHDDVFFVNKIIDDIVLNPSYNIDLSRIFATGFSSGGAMSFYLAFELSNRIASVAAVAAPMTDTLIDYICSPVRQISVLHIQGTNDPLLPANGNEWALPLIKPTEYWAGVNGCSAIPDSTQLEDTDIDDNSTVTLFDYNGCDQETEVKLYRINGGGHTWPGGTDGNGTLNNDIKASLEIWSFFKRNPLPDYLPPYIVSADSLFQQESIEVTTSKDATVYILPDNIEKDIVMIRNECLDSAACEASLAQTIPIEGFDNGEYWLYGMDNTGNISEPKAFSIYSVGFEIQTRSRFIIHPNPTNNTFTFELENPIQAEIEIHNLNGQIIYRRQIQSASEQIDMTLYPKGVYLVTVKSNNWVRTEKIIKL